MAADVTALPFADASFDAVLATHMLYHVEPPLRAISELRRVLRSGGVLVAVTNGPDHLDGFDRVIRRATSIARWDRSMSRFSTENGARQLLTVFDHVDSHEVHGELVVPETDPVMDYVESIRSFLAPQLPMGWSEAMAAIRAQVEREIAATGAFTSAIHSGAFVCRPAERS